jgi:hypothetical protein
MSVKRESRWIAHSTGETLPAAFEARIVALQ